MSLDARIFALAEQVGRDVKSLRAQIGAPLHSIDPRIVAHRHGGSNVSIENSLYALLLAIAAGICEVETDAHLLSDGSVGIMHDDTVDRMTDGTGAVADFTRETWSQLRLVAPSWLGAKAQYPSGPPPLLEDLLDALRGTGVRLRLEIKASAATAAAVGILGARNWPKSDVIITSFVRSALDPAIAAGYRVGFIGDIQDYTDFADLKAQGIDYFDASMGSVTAARVAAAHAAGIKITAWTLNRRTEAEAMFEMGVDHVTCDDPLWVAKASPRRNVDTYIDGLRWSGFLESSSSDPAGIVRVLQDGALRLGGSQYYGLLQGWACPLPDPLGWAVEFDVKTLYVAEATRHADITVLVSDKYWTDAAGHYSQLGFNAFQRRSGEMTLWRMNVGSATNVTTVAGAALTESTYRYRLEVTSEFVRFTNLNTGQQAIANTTQIPSTHKGAFFYLAAGSGNSTYEFSNVRVFDTSTPYRDDTVLCIEGSAVDTSPNAVALSAFGGAEFVEGVATLGGAASDEAKYFKTAPSGALMLYGDFTIEFNVADDSDSTTFFGPIYSNENPAALSLISFSGNTPGARPVTFRSNGGVRAQTPSLDENFHEIAFVRKGATTYTYVDGVLTGSSTSFGTGTWQFYPGAYVGYYPNELNTQHPVKFKRLRVTRVARYSGNRYAVPTSYAGG
ncbi:MAG: hypothetical protein LBF91_01455 [Azoarcus sp.]|jgi:glycerophosphoryl diester phosphodiesterase|nr:hypothetical protein [Azoarcus sp.]